MREMKPQLPVDLKMAAAFGRGISLGGSTVPAKELASSPLGRHLARRGSSSISRLGGSTAPVPAPLGRHQARRGSSSTPGDTSSAWRKALNSWKNAKELSDEMEMLLKDPEVTVGTLRRTSRKLAASLKEPLEETLNEGISGKEMKLHFIESELLKLKYSFKGSSTINIAGLGVGACLICYVPLSIYQIHENKEKIKAADMKAGKKMKALKSRLKKVESALSEKGWENSTVDESEEPESVEGGGDKDPVVQKSWVEWLSSFIM